MASLIIAVIALIGALSPIPYVTAYGIWVVLLGLFLMPETRQNSIWQEAAAVKA